jgi:hypothetical protein
MRSQKKWDNVKAHWRCISRSIISASFIETLRQEWKREFQSMSGRSKNSWKQLSDARLDTWAKEFVRTELELALTFIQVARTKYSMGNVAAADNSRNNAEKAYQSALKYFGKLADPTLSQHLKFTNLFSEVKQELTALSKSATR